MPGLNDLAQSDTDTVLDAAEPYLTTQVVTVAAASIPTYYTHKFKSQKKSGAVNSGPTLLRN